MAISDYCVNPIDYLLLFIQPYTSINQYVTYYLSCSGLSPFYETIYDVEYLLKEFNFYINYLFTTGNDCLTNNSYNSIQSNINILQSFFPSLYEILSCDNYSKEWLELIQVDICHNIVGGLFLIWILQLIMNGFLICLLIYSSYLYPYLKQFHYYRNSINENRTTRSLDVSQEGTKDGATSSIFSPLPHEITKDHKNVEMT